MTFPGGENEHEHGNPEGEWQGDSPEQYPEDAPEQPDQPLADEQLTLTGEEDALPWLAGGEEYEDEQGGGTDYRILAFALLALVLLGGILWGAKSFFDGQTGGSGAAVADGSTIAAPPGDYKERPADPGGQDVAGTGDVAYEVGEGVTREGRVGTPPAGAAAQPSIDIGPNAAGSAAAPGAVATRAPSTAAAAAGGVGVQVGAYQSRESAETGWQQLAGRFSALQGVNHRIVEGTIDSGTIYRLQAVAANGAAADALCRSIRGAGGDCQVKR